MSIIYEYEIFTFYFKINLGQLDKDKAVLSTNVSCWQVTSRQLDTVPWILIYLMEVVFVRFIYVKKL